MSDFATPLVKIVVDEQLVKQLAKEEIKRMLQGQTDGIWWDMQRLEHETCRKRDWLLENVILNPKHKEEMSIISNNREGGRWMFRAAEMKGFLDRNFHNLNRSKKGVTT